MKFHDVVGKRRMVRAFEPTPLPREVVERILATAQRGPSAGFTQGFEFLVFDGPDQTARFWAYQTARGHVPASRGDAVRAAPLLIVPLAHAQAYVDRYQEPDKVQVGRTTTADWPAPYWIVDTAFAALLILLTSVDAGLGAFYFSLAPTRAEVPPFHQAFGIPEEYEPIGAIAIGYPAPDRPSPSLQRGRRPSTEVVHLGTW